MRTKSIESRIFNLVQDIDVQFPLVGFDSHKQRPNHYAEASVAAVRGPRSRCRLSGDSFAGGDGVQRLQGPWLETLPTKLAAQVPRKARIHRGSTRDHHYDLRGREINITLSK